MGYFLERCTSPLCSPTIHFRTLHSYAPFGRLTNLSLVDPIDQRVEHEAWQLAKELELQRRRLQLTTSELVGPIPPFFNRLDGRYRWQIIIRSPDPCWLLKDINVSPKWILELDPVSTL